MRNSGLFSRPASFYLAVVARFCATALSQTASEDHLRTSLVTDVIKSLPRKCVRTDGLSPTCPGSKISVAFII